MAACEARDEAQGCNADVCVAERKKLRAQLHAVVLVLEKYDFCNCPYHAEFHDLLIKLKQS